MQKLDLDMIRINMADPMVCLFNTVDSKSFYANTILDNSLGWLSLNLGYYINTLLSKDEIKQKLFDFLLKNIPRPLSNSWIDTITLNIFFNRALNIIVKFVVNKVFELIFVGDTLELNPKYVQNNPENII